MIITGGLSTSCKAIKSNFALSAGVAVTGICLPIALSFSLLNLAKATTLQAFAAGASLLHELGHEFHRLIHERPDDNTPWHSIDNSCHA